MERIKALQQRLPRERRGELNLMYMNAFAELHNYGGRLGCDYRTMTPEERTAFIRSVGRTALRNRRLTKLEHRLGAEAEVVGASVLPHMAALEIIDWIEELRETVLQDKIPVLLKQDRDSELFSQRIDEIRGFYADVEIFISQM